MTPSSEMEIFGGGPKGKVVAPGKLVICPFDKNCNHFTKNWLFAPNIQIFGSKNTFLSLAANWSLTKKVSYWFPDMRAPKVLLPPSKKGFLAKKMAKFGPKLSFIAKYRHFWPLWSIVWPKNNADKLPRWFFHYMGTKTLTNFRKNYYFWPKNGQIWS